LKFKFVGLFISLFVFMHKFRKFVIEYNTHIKYILLIVVFFSMIYSIRSYLNRIAIEEAVIQRIEESTLEQDKYNYREQFQLAYLSSSFADYFLTHENNALFRNEIIINFKQQELKTLIESKTGFDAMFYVEERQTTQESWRRFIRDKINLSKLK